jgi:hypothetical protein
MIPQSKCAWLSTPIVPIGGEEIDQLAKLARQARKGRASFELWFTRDELRRLGEAAFTWGKRVTGQYRAFDVMVVRAINEALGEPLRFVLRENPRAPALDARVVCTSDGEFFCLSGEAPFSIVFGYGTPGVDANTAIARQLGDAVRSNLASAISMLGWPLEKLVMEPMLAPVRNAMFGLPVGLGTNSDSDLTEFTSELALKFHGPFAVTSSEAVRSALDDALAQTRGIYLWTYKVGEAFHVHYVGQTARSFAARFTEHMGGILSGEYDTANHDDIAKGRWSVVWPDNSKPTLPGFLDSYERLAAHRARAVRETFFHFAPVDDEKLLNRIEGRLGRYFSERVTSLPLFNRGIRVPALVRPERAICLQITAECPIEGLPPSIIV